MEKDITVTHMIAGLTKVFSRIAIPDVSWLDEGPQFTAKVFQEFAREWGFQHLMSYPQKQRQQ